MLSSSSFAEESIERIIAASNGLVARHLAIRLNPMLQAVQFPTSITNLHSCLSNVNWDTLTLRRNEKGVTQKASKPLPNLQIVKWDRAVGQWAISLQTITNTTEKQMMKKTKRITKIKEEIKLMKIKCLGLILKSFEFERGYCWKVAYINSFRDQSQIIFLVWNWHHFHFNDMSATEEFNLPLWINVFMTSCFESGGEFHKVFS